MNDRRVVRRSSVVGLAVALALAASPVASAGGGKPARFEIARILIEMNATAQDAGIQMLIDAEGWEDVTIFGPGGDQKLLNVRARGPVGTIGVTELFFESAEPSLADLPLEDLLAMYPEGTYRIEGHTVEGREIVGRAVLSHEIPGGPHVVAPLDGEATDPGNTVIDWDPVVEPAGIQITGYQVIVELPEPQLRVFSVDLGASVTALRVPPEFLQPGVAYLFEVLAVAENGNQTITEGTFSTLP
jgi:hypothetical protein